MPADLRPDADAAEKIAALTAECENLEFNRRTEACKFSNERELRLRDQTEAKELIAALTAELGAIRDQHARELAAAQARVGRSERMEGAIVEAALPVLLAAERKAVAERIVAAAHAAYRKGGVGDAECTAILEAVEAAAAIAAFDKEPTP